MSTAKEEIFSRIRKALVDVKDSDPAEAEIGWQYKQPTKLDGDIVDIFLELVADYKAEVERVKAADLPGAIVAHLKQIGAGSVLLPDGVDESWRQAIEQAGFDIRKDDNLTARQLNEIDAVVTAAAVGVANTGTFALDHRPDQGRRALTLVPDAHICVLRADQVVSNTPEAIARLRASITDGQPLTFVAGPSATSDIELSRVEGVHGPRTLHVIVAD
uniref:LutC/YkgG family protein n=1 Tax=Vaginimicrobium propionicum TaxID=1871034 RepID=UPI0009713704|nr:LUD domain-containing protein [Vaginimicrobium propionicum]